MTDETKPNGWCAWHPEKGYDVWRQHVKRDAEMKLGDGWQIKPVYLVTESQMRRMEALEGIAKLVRETNIGRPAILEKVETLPPKEPKE